MPDTRRWLTSVCKEAAKAEIKMPWTRGETRAAFIAKRAAEPDVEQTAAQA